jgi:hypothetical protein
MTRRGRASAALGLEPLHLDTLKPRDDPIAHAGCRNAIQAKTPQRTGAILPRPEEIASRSQAPYMLWHVGAEDAP